MKSNVLKTIGVIGLIGISIFLSISLSVIVNGKFALTGLKEMEGLCFDGLSIPNSFPHSFPHSMSHEVYAFYNSKETIIYQNKDANYPEVAFITLVAVKRDLINNNLELYDCKDGPIKIKVGLETTGEPPDDVIGYIATELPYQLANLTENGLRLSNVGGTKEIFSDAELEGGELGGELNWKRGLFQALGYDAGAISSLRGALAATNQYKGKRMDGDYLVLDAPRNDIVVSFGEAEKGIVVVAVKTWNYVKDAGDIVFKLENITEDAGDLWAEMKSENVKIDLNVDNVDFTEINSGHDNKKLVILPRSQTYDQIIEMKVWEAQTGRSLKGGDGPDWLEVAAVDIYNNPPNDNAKKIFSHILNIRIEELKNESYPERGDSGQRHYGEVKPAIPRTVLLNPYKEETRFNSENTRTSYGSVYKNWRDNICFHEALHCYQFSASSIRFDQDTNGTLYDTELGWMCLDGSYSGGDDLYVNQDGGQDRFLKFSFDDRSRGFLRRDASITPEIEGWLEGVSGDNNNVKYTHSSTSGTFITNVYGGRGGLGKLTADDIKNIFKGNGIERLIPTEIPEDLPELKKDFPKILKIYIYKRPLEISGSGGQTSLPGGQISIGGLMYNCGDDLNGIVEIVPIPLDSLIRNYGSYQPCKHSFKFNGYAGTSSDKISRAENYIKLFTEYGYGLYILYCYEHKPADYYYENGIPANEYDADYFGITHGEGG